VAGVRAEDLHVHAGGSGVAHSLAARVRRIEILSDQRLVHLALDGGSQEVVSAVPGAAGFTADAAVDVELRRVLWFDAQGHRVAA
jgi:hypothetical protein